MQDLHSFIYLLHQDYTCPPRYTTRIFMCIVLFLVLPLLSSIGNIVCSLLNLLIFQLGSLNIKYYFMFTFPSSLLLLPDIFRSLDDIFLVLKFVFYYIPKSCTATTPELFLDFYCFWFGKLRKIYEIPLFLLLLKIGGREIMMILNMAKMRGEWEMDMTSRIDQKGGGIGERKWSENIG